jgi:transposase
MLTIPTTVKIFVCLQPIDFRRGFDGLAEMVREGLREDPFSGHWFVFRNRRGDRFKLLLWDEDGLMLVYKRLEIGKYQFPHTADDRLGVQVTAQELSLMLWGIDPRSVSRQKRYVLPVT